MRRMGLFGVAVLALLLSAHSLHAQPLEPFGKIELSGGGEKESHTPAGGRFTAEALGVWPFMANFGVQGALHYVGGLGSRVGFNIAPVFAFDGGKVGFFVSYQHRGLRDTDFVYLMPAVAFYLPQFNLNAWYSQPVTGPQGGGHRTEYGVNRLQVSASYFAASDWWGPYLRRDDVELIGGLQLNTFAGSGHHKLGGTGFGPTLGASFRPMPGVAVNLVRATFDHEGRYRVATGLEFFFDAKGGTSLKDMRRKYLEPNFDGPQNVGKKKPHSSRGCNPCTSDRNAKTNIERIDQREILARVAKMPIQQWNYKDDDASVRHLGPMAQDFHAAFGLGDTDKGIYPVDGNGVALASIQALYEIVQEKDQKIATLESRLAQLEKGKAHSPLDDIAAAWPFIALVAVGGVLIARRKFN